MAVKHTGQDARLCWQKAHWAGRLVKEVLSLLRCVQDDQRLTKDSLHMATRRPEPYRHPMKKTIDEVT